MTAPAAFGRAWARGRTVAPDALALGVVAIAVAGLCVWPLVRLGIEGVFPGGRFAPERAADLLSQTATWRATWHSIETSAIGGIGALALGFLFAAVIALTDVRAKALLVFAFMLPAMIPPQVTALAWMQVTGPASPFLGALGLAPPPGTDNPIVSREGIMLLLAIQHAPLAFLVLRAGLRALPRELIEAARLAGAGRQRLVLDIVIPLVGPSLAAAFALAFVSALGNFGIPALLGIPERYYVLPTLIYMRLSSHGPSVLSDVALLSILVGLVGLAAIAVQGLATRRMHWRFSARGGRRLDVRLGAARIWIEVLLWSVIAIVLVIPLAALIATSLVPAYGVALTPATLTLANYAEVLLRQDATARAFFNSTLLSVVAAGLIAAGAIVIGYFAVWRRSRLARVLAALADAPYALPGVVLSIAMILVFLPRLPLLGVSLYGTLWIILAAYLARFFVLAARPVAAAFQAVDPALEDAARLAGARLGLRLRSVIAPLVGPAAAAGAILVVLTASHELTVSALIWSVGTETIGVVIYNLEESGFTTLSSALSVVVVAAVLVIMLAAQSLAPLLPPGVLPWADETTPTRPPA